MIADCLLYSSVPPLRHGPVAVILPCRILFCEADMCWYAKQTHLNTQPTMSKGIVSQMIYGK